MSTTNRAKDRDDHGHLKRSVRGPNKNMTTPGFLVRLHMNRPRRHEYRHLCYQVQRGRDPDNMACPWARANRTSIIGSQLRKLIALAGVNAMRKPKYTLAELLAATPPEAFRSPEALEWDRMPAMGREWPNPGWDEALDDLQGVIDEGRARARRAYALALADEEQTLSSLMPAVNYARALTDAWARGELTAEEVAEGLRRYSSTLPPI
jgi:hypothetical protein